mgnify:CR=1 FL=1
MSTQTGNYFTFVSLTLFLFLSLCLRLFVCPCTWNVCSIESIESHSHALKMHDENRFLSLFVWKFNLGFFFRSAIFLLSVVFSLKDKGFLNYQASLTQAVFRLISSYDFLLAVCQFKQKQAFFWCKTIFFDLFFFISLPNLSVAFHRTICCTILQICTTGALLHSRSGAPKLENWPVRKFSFIFFLPRWHCASSAAVWSLTVR